MIGSNPGLEATYAELSDGSLLLLTDGDNAELLRLSHSGEKEAG